MGRSPGEFTKGETFHDGIEVVYTAVEMGMELLATLLPCCGWESDGCSKSNVNSSFPTLSTLSLRAFGRLARVKWIIVGHLNSHHYNFIPPLNLITRNNGLLYPPIGIVFNPPSYRSSICSPSSSRNPSSSSSPTDCCPNYCSCFYCCSRICC